MFVISAPRVICSLAVIRCCLWFTSCVHLRLCGTVILINSERLFAAVSCTVGTRLPLPAAFLQFNRRRRESVRGKSLESSLQAKQCDARALPLSQAQNVGRCLCVVVIKGELFGREMMMIIIHYIYIALYMVLKVTLQYLPIKTMQTNLC